MSSTKNLIDIGKNSKKELECKYSSDWEYEGYGTRNTPKGRTAAIDRIKGQETASFKRNLSYLDSKQSSNIDRRDQNVTMKTKHKLSLQCRQQVGDEDDSGSNTQLPSHTLSQYNRANTKNSALLYSSVYKPSQTPSSFKKEIYRSTNGTAENLRHKAVLNNIKLQRSRSTSYLSSLEPLDDGVTHPSETETRGLTPKIHNNKLTEPLKEKKSTEETTDKKTTVIPKGKVTPLNGYTEQIAQVVEKRARLKEKLQLRRQNIETRKNGKIRGIDMPETSNDGQPKIKDPALVPSLSLNYSTRYGKQANCGPSEKNKPNVTTAKHKQSGLLPKDTPPSEITGRMSQKNARDDKNNSNTRANLETFSQETEMRETIKKISDDLWRRITTGEKFYTDRSSEIETQSLSNPGPAHPLSTTHNHHLSRNGAEKQNLTKRNEQVEIMYDLTDEKIEALKERESNEREIHPVLPDPILGSKAAEKPRYYRSRSQTTFSNGSNDQAEGLVTLDLPDLYIVTNDPETRREIRRRAAGEAAILRREASNFLWHAMNLEQVCDHNARVRHVYLQQ